MRSDCCVIQWKGVSTLSDVTRSVEGAVRGKPSAASLLAANASGEALKTVLTSLEDSKAEDIVTIDIQNKSSLGDFM